MVVQRRCGVAFVVADEGVKLARLEKYRVVTPATQLESFRPRLSSWPQPAKGRERWPTAMTQESRATEIAVLRASCEAVSGRAS